MTTEKLAIKIIIYEIIFLGILLAITWLDEFLDIPYILFGAPKTPINIIEIIIETIILLFFGLLIITITYTLVRKIINLENNRHDLERIFFHDILNLACGINIASLLLTKKEELDEKYKKSLYDSSNLLTNEIKSYKDMISAEKNELTLELSSIRSKSFLMSILRAYESHDVAKGKKIVISSDCKDVNFISDKNLVERIIVNLLKNALEASELGQTITLGCRATNTNISFWCHNNSYIPKEIQRKLFQKAYSTKGERRGLGTYSIKLLTEKYLQGSVNFVSTQEMGTTFTISFPLAIGNRKKELTMRHMLSQED